MIICKQQVIVLINSAIKIGHDLARTARVERLGARLHAKLIGRASFLQRWVKNNVWMIFRTASAPLPDSRHKWHNFTKTYEGRNFQRDTTPSIGRIDELT